MKKLFLHVVFVIGFCFCSAKNPVIDKPHFYTADPSPKVWDDSGRLYMYCTYDVVGSLNETEWHVFSSCDLENWTDHGVALTLDDIAWADKHAWAPDAAYRNGKFYFYYPVKEVGTGINCTGVAVGDSPIGPFVDSGKPLLKRGHDPCVFKDDDGEFYLYSQLRVAKLNKDMISLAQEPKNLKLIGRELPKKKEAVWVFKRNDIYYWIIAEGFNEFTYWMGDSPYGPFTYRGILMPRKGKGNNHPGIIKFKDKWILFYHQPAKGAAARRIHAEYLHFNEDGTMKQVKMTKEGVKFPPCKENGKKKSDTISLKKKN